MTYRTAGPLIGLIGYARTGKDTFAAELVAAYGYRRVAFADPLRAAAYALNPIVRSHWDGPIRLAEVVDEIGWERAKDEYPEVRRTLQHIGQGMRDTVDEDLWLNVAMDKVDGYGGPVVITDVRYRNEADAIRDRGGVLVRVIRPGARPANAHESETALDRMDTDEVVRNVAGLEELREKAHFLHLAISQ
jgi:hypothetical protein